MNRKIITLAIIGSAFIGAYCCLPRTLPAARAQQEPAGPPTHSVWDGVYTEKQAKRGEDLYTQNCRMCHGTALTGDDNASALAGMVFLANWNHLTVGDLFERIRVSMPQDDPGSLSRQKYADIVAYILSYNKFPAGKTDLVTQEELLKLIRIDALKPESKQDSASQKEK